MKRQTKQEPAPQANGAITRRSLLQGAGLTIAASAVPSLRDLHAAKPQTTAGKSAGYVMDELTSYTSEAAKRALPDAVAEKTKQHVLDTLAAMISGSQLPPGKAAIQFALAYGGEKVSTVACSNILCGPIEAALTNGILAHSDETDDSHSPSETHPGCSIVPAALAVGERFGVDGAHFLRAVALGYDIGTRVTMTLGVANFQVGGRLSSHAVGGCFGSAAAGACAAGLSDRQMRWVFDYTVQQASGSTLWQRDTDHIEKAFVFAGMPARNGVTSAMVVQSGWTGVEDVFSGPYNFLNAYLPQADPATLIEKLGERYEVTRTNFKKWTVGSPIQAPLDALENLRKSHSFDANEVQKVVVRIAPAEGALVNNREMPDICLQHMVAVMLIDKTATFRSIHDKARMQDPAVLRLRAKVQYVPDEELARLLPARVAIVELTLADGTVFKERVDAVRGTVENPMTREEVVAKARDLIAPVIGLSASNSLIEKVFAIEKVKDIRELRPLFQLG
ncbi:MAG TPA: MmgE/PrpD family protein [Candidatus Sulfotelmatobacter sp.]|nr:MmgE/PrpD family protein [Candidatus Sulfotelmatobacter sp.]